MASALRHLVLASAVLAGSLGAAAPALARPSSPSGGAAETVAQIVGADGSIDFVPVEAPTVADEVRLADAMPGSIGHAFEQPVSVEAATSNDPYRGSEWDMDTLHVDDVKPYLSSLGSQIVAVIDSGVNASMADWNPGQVRCDLGADFVADSYTTSSGGTGCVDPNGHGTHVAGTVGAVGDNGIGVEGVASGVQIMPVRVLDANGSGNSTSTAQGIVWAVDHGATVLSMSLGGGYSASYDTAIQYATDHGVSVVAAAGNNGAADNAKMWPGASPGSICVTATDRNNAHASFSNSSGTATIAAPGVTILSLDAKTGSYVYMSGTSMATPHVSGAAALYRAAHPSATPAQVTSALTGSATDLGAAGWDSYFGAGLLNPYRLITGSDFAEGVRPSPTPAATPAPTPSATPSGSPAVSPTAPATAPTTAKPSPSPTTTAPAPAAPAAPARLSAAPAVGTVKLTWTKVTGTTARPLTGYRVYRGATLLGTVSSATTTFTDRVAAGTTYTYTVRSIGPAGLSAPVTVRAAARYPAAAISASAGSKIVIKGANLKPGTTLTARETYGGKTVTLGSAKVGPTGAASLSVTPAKAAKSGTLTIAGTDRNNTAVKVQKIVTRQ